MAHIVIIIVGVIIFVVACIGILVNGGILYFAIRYKQLRNLSIGGLIALSGLNDALMNVQFLLKLPESIRYAQDTLVSYRYCTLEQGGEI